MTIQKAISGIQPSNQITLGNYLGAIKPLIEFQDQYEMYIFVADLHALSAQTYDPKTLYEHKISLISTYIAMGLDIKKTHIFYQSEVWTHLALNWILTCNTNMGELSRMTQFKDKSNKLVAHNGTEYIPVGLFAYPILMAADILLYDVNYVIVGADQKQHVELTRDIASRMNSRYGNMFTIPQPLIPKQGARIMDLVSPQQKMSKSSINKNGTIFLLDSPEIASKKIMGAKTDSLDQVKYDSTKQPGISNLMVIYSCITNKTIEWIEKQYNGKNYGVFKKDLALIVNNFLKSFQDKYYSALKQYPIFAKQIKLNAEYCASISTIRLQQIYQKIGLIK